MDGELKYSIWDPTGNITALVESPVGIPEQPAAAAEIMRRHPAVEQVGFVRFPEGDGSMSAELRMAGGEFCGNASMCTAALCVLRKGRASADSISKELTLSLRVSGVAEPLDVRLKRETADAFSAGVKMPPALCIENREFEFEDRKDRLPLIRMEGIDHILIGADAALFALREDRQAAGLAVRSWCAALSSPGLGLMFLEKREQNFSMTPLVYIPGSDTLFWEQSCASGSAAVGMVLAREKGARTEATLNEPGGILRVESAPENGETRLYGKTKLLGDWKTENRQAGPISASE